MVKIYCNDKLKNVLKSNKVDNYLPAYSGESAGLDLYNTGDDIIIPYIGNKIKTPKTLIPTGLHIAVPKGYVALIQERGSVISFTMKGIHPHDIATILDEDGIAIRAGHHCCQILHDKIGISASARASLGVYNSKQDIDKLSDAIDNCKKIFKV